MNFKINLARTKVSDLQFVIRMPAALIELIEREYPLEGPSLEWANWKFQGQLALVVHNPADIQPESPARFVLQKCPGKQGTVRKLHIYPIHHDEDYEIETRTAKAVVLAARWLGACPEHVAKIKAAVRSEIGILERILERIEEDL